MKSHFSFDTRRAQCASTHLSIAPNHFTQKRVDAKVKKSESVQLKVKLHLANISRSNNPCRMFMFFSLSAPVLFVLHIQATTGYFPWRSQYVCLIFHKVNLAVNIVQFPSRSAPFRQSLYSHIHLRRCAIETMTTTSYHSNMWI